ncbi:hypothetical protein INQ73_28590, partial [Klebsiella pneumoniae]|nr:hypothetical protein [Klebsiella pneumoniae]
FASDIKITNSVAGFCVMIWRIMPLLSSSCTKQSSFRNTTAGHGTSQISTQMNIKAKTVSSHKGNIKKKIQTHNKQVIYHIV